MARRLTPKSRLVGYRHKKSGEIFKVGSQGTARQIISGIHASCKKAVPVYARRTHKGEWV